MAEQVDGWSGLYENPEALTVQWGHQRIFAPAAYRMVRSLPLVPVVHSEALELARVFPVCWSLTEAGPTLCVLRSLFADGAASAGPAIDLGALPLIFQAFPIVVPHVPDAILQRIVVDRTIADEPTDIGAPLLLGDGRLSRAAAARAKIAVRTSQALGITREIGRRLHEAGLIEPWPLQFDLGHGESIDIGHLGVLTRSRLADGALHRLVADLGVEVGLFLAAHRISLFRVATLLHTARAAVAARAANGLGTAKAA